MTSSESCPKRSRNPIKCPLVLVLVNAMAGVFLGGTCLLLAACVPTGVTYKPLAESLSPDGKHSASLVRLATQQPPSQVFTLQIRTSDGKVVEERTYSFVASPKLRWSSPNTVTLEAKAIERQSSSKSGEFAIVEKLTKSDSSASLEIPD